MLKYKKLVSTLGFSDDRLKLTTYKGATVPVGFIDGRLSAQEAYNHLRRLGIEEELYPDVMKGRVTVPHGFEVTYLESGKTYYSGQSVPTGFGPSPSWDDFRNTAEQSGKWSIAEVATDAEPVTVEPMSKEELSDAYERRLQNLSPHDMKRLTEAMFSRIDELRDTDPQAAHMHETALTERYNALLDLERKPKRVVIIDDDSTRVSALVGYAEKHFPGAEITYSPTFVDISGYDVAMLDHDLGTGGDMSEHIKNHYPDGLEGLDVLVHSMNPVGAKNITDKIGGKWIDFGQINDAGYSSDTVPKTHSGGNLGAPLTQADYYQAEDLFGRYKKRNNVLTRANSPTIANVSASAAPGNLGVLLAGLFLAGKNNPQAQEAFSVLNEQLENEAQNKRAKLTLDTGVDVSSFFGIGNTANTFESAIELAKLYSSAEEVKSEAADQQRTIAELAAAVKSSLDDPKFALVDQELVRLLAAIRAREVIKEIRNGNAVFQAIVDTILLSHDNIVDKSTRYDLYQALANTIGSNLKIHTADGRIVYGLEDLLDEHIPRDIKNIPRTRLNEVLPTVIENWKAAENFKQGLRDLLRDADVRMAKDNSSTWMVEVMGAIGRRLEEKSDSLETSLLMASPGEVRTLVDSGFVETPDTATPYDMLTEDNPLTRDKLNKTVGEFARNKRRNSQEAYIVSLSKPNAEVELTDYLMSKGKFSQEEASHAASVVCARATRAKKRIESALGISHTITNRDIVQGHFRSLTMMVSVFAQNHKGNSATPVTPELGKLHNVLSYVLGDELEGYDAATGAFAAGDVGVFAEAATRLRVLPTIDNDEVFWDEAMRAEVQSAYWDAFPLERGKKINDRELLRHLCSTNRGFTASVLISANIRTDARDTLPERDYKEFLKQVHAIGLSPENQGQIQRHIEDVEKIHRDFFGIELVAANNEKLSDTERDAMMRRLADPELSEKDGVALVTALACTSSPLYKKPEIAKAVGDNLRKLATKRALDYMGANGVDSQLAQSVAEYVADSIELKKSTSKSGSIGKSQEKFMLSGQLMYHIAHTKGAHNFRRTTAGEKIDGCMWTDADGIEHVFGQVHNSNNGLGDAWKITRGRGQTDMYPLEVKAYANANASSVPHHGSTMVAATPTVLDEWKKSRQNLRIHPALTNVLPHTVPSEGYTSLYTVGLDKHWASWNPIMSVGRNFADSLCINPDGTERQVKIDRKEERLSRIRDTA